MNGLCIIERISLSDFSKFPLTYKLFGKIILFSTIHVLRLIYRKNSSICTDLNIALSSYLGGLVE